MNSETELRAFIADYPREMAFGEEDPGTVLDRYFASGFEFRNDGLLLDRDLLIAHTRPARKNVVGVRVELHEALVSGGRFAARYTLHAQMRGDRTVVNEIYMFGALAGGGRVGRIDQTARAVPQDGE